MAAKKKVSKKKAAKKKPTKAPKEISFPQLLGLLERSIELQGVIKTYLGRCWYAREGKILVPTKTVLAVKSIAIDDNCEVDCSPKVG